VKKLWATLAATAGTAAVMLDAARLKSRWIGVVVTAVLLVVTGVAVGFLLLTPQTAPRPIPTVENQRELQDPNQDLNDELEATLRRQVETQRARDRDRQKEGPRPEPTVKGPRPEPTVKNSTEDSTVGRDITHDYAESPLDAALQTLVSGNIAFNAPDRIILGKSQIIEAKLSTKMPPNDLIAALSEAGA
jgi:hypothetical protein